MKMFKILALVLIKGIVVANLSAQQGQMDWYQVTPSADWSGRLLHSSVVFNNKIWVLGGVGQYSHELRDVWYSTNGQDWICATSAAAWSARHGHGTVVYDNKIWVMGGYDSTYQNDVWYSADGINWIMATDSAPWSRRTNFSLVVYDNKMWLMGGYQFYNHRYNDVWYSTDGVNWTLATDSASWTKRDGHTSVVYDNKMWVIGGQISFAYKNDVWYSSDGVNWIQATNNAGWTGRKYNGLIAYDNKMWIIGGYLTYNSFRNDVWYSTDGISWISATASAGWTQRYGHTSVIFDNKMLVLGGYDGYNSYRNDVWYSRGSRITLISPNGGEYWSGGSTQTIRWRPFGTGFTNYRLLLSRNGGYQYPDTIADNIPATETTYNWTIPLVNNINNRIMVQMLDTNGVVIVQDASDGSFSIQTIAVISPNGGEIIAGGCNYLIKWRILFTGFARYRLILLRDFGNISDTIAHNVSSTDTTYNWTVPTINSTTCQVLIQMLDTADNVICQDITNGVFTIQTLTVVSPNGGEVWNSGSYQVIKWQTTNNINFSSYRLLLSVDGGYFYNDTIVSNIPPGDSEYLWLVIPIDGMTCQLKAQALNASGQVICEDASNAYFIIRTQPILISPNGGENLLGASNYLIKWRTTGAGFARYRILLSQNGGSSYPDTIAHNIVSTETTYNWTVSSINSSTCRIMIQIINSDGSVVSQDASDGNFIIQTVILISPNGGETWPGGSSQTIKWRTTTGLNSARFRLLLSRNSGSTYPDTIVHNILPAESTYFWITPAINVTTCRIKIQVLDTMSNIICEDVNNGDFTIRTQTTVISPNGGETWLGGTNQMIKWRTVGSGFARFRILFSQNGGSIYPDTIVHNVSPSESTYLWFTPMINVMACRMKVQILDALGNLVSEDASNGNFTIQTIIIVSPNGGEVWPGESNQIIKWRNSTSFNFARFRILLSRNSGLTYLDTIRQYIPSTESTYLWLTPTINVTTCRVKVQVLDTSANLLCEDVSNGNFTIHTITLISPNGGEYIQGGSTRTIRWRITMGGEFARFRILFSNNAGTTYSDTITHNVATTETLYNWTVPTLNCNTCRVMVQILDGVDNVTCEDVSNSNFTIDSDPPSSFSLALPLNNAWTNASPRFVWHRATDNFAMSYYQLSIAIPNETLLINSQDSINPIPSPGSTWRQATASAEWSSRQYHTSVVFDNKIWVIGGYDGSCRNDVWYSTNGINWICATNSAQWSPRCGHTSVVFDNKMWVIGGYNDNNRNDVWYSTDGVTWTCATPSAQWPGRFAHTSIIFDNKIWVLGGSNRNDVWYSSNGVNWTCATQSAGWSSRDNHTSLAFDNKMWVLGGSNRDDVWYSSDGLNWTCATTFAWYYGGRYGHTSAVFDNKMWVIGGGYPGSDVWYSSNGVDWTEATSYAEWTARLNHTSVIFKGMMWVLGGFDRDYNTRRNDVWYSVSPPCLPEGIQTWWVTAFDRVGNSRRSNETFTVRVDTTPPSVPTLISPANGIILTNSSVTFIWHSSSDILSGFHYYRFQVANNINFINPTITTVIDTFITATLTDTTYFWRVKAIDSVENESEWSTVGYFRIRTTGIEEKQQQIFDITRLTVKVYPNPAKSFAEIHYTVPVKSRILIQLCDVTGRFIKTLVDNEKRTGIYQVTLNTKELSAGVYFVSLRTDFREQIINRLIILK